MLKQRILTALLLLPPGIYAVLWLPHQGFQILIAILFGLGAREWCQFVGLTGNPPRIAIGLTTTLMILVLHRLVPPEFETWPLAGGLVLWALGLLWLKWREFGEQLSPASVLAKSIFGLLAFAVAALAVAYLTADGMGRGWLIVLLCIIWGADIGAYFAGRTFGYNKLAPAISPSKTWEGVWGGQAFVIAICLVTAQLFELDRQQTIGLVLAGVVTAAVSVVGDLLVSLMKRQVGLKDAGRLLPGHGGILDRFDSLIAAAPVFVFAHRLLNL
jgi:phosphatidate cytidylyltransferase